MKLIGILAQIATQLALITAIVFGIRNIRESQRAHMLRAATALVQTLQTPDFTRAMELLMRLPERADPKLVHDDPELTGAMYTASHVFEGIGMLVFYRLMPLHMVDHLIGGYTRATWNRLQPYVMQRRATDGAMFAEWFQWLAARMEERPAAGKIVGAPIAHREWAP